MCNVIPRQTNWAGTHQPAAGSSLPGGSPTRDTVNLHQLPTHLEEMVFLREHYQRGALPSGHKTRSNALNMPDGLQGVEKISQRCTKRSCSQTVANTAHVTSGDCCSLPRTLQFLGSGEGAFCHPELGLLSCPVLLLEWAAMEPSLGQITGLISEEQPRGASVLHFRGAAQESSRIFKKMSPRYKLKVHWSKNYRCLLETLHRREGTVQEVLKSVWKRTS